ncbi:MAG: thioredoxin domain-containing protein [Rhodothermales bacterium]
MSRQVTSRVIDRVMLVLGMLGVLVVVHLGIQESRGFDQGCTGFLAPASVEAFFDCGTVLASGAGTFLGISNTILGMLFYLGIVGASVAALLFRGEPASWGRRLRAVMIGAGVVYTSYLVYYQLFVISGLCALCMVSAAIVLLLAITQIIALRGSQQKGVSFFSVSSDPSFAFMKEFRFVGTLAVALIVLAAADVAYYNRLEPSRTATAATPAVDTTPRAATSANANPVSACGYDTSKPFIEDFEQYVGVQDPMEGNPDARVTVMEFFDPNCPHCKTMHAVMNEVVEGQHDNARFFYKPVALWPHSVPQIEALYAAAQENLFEEMLQAQFNRQNQSGLNIEELRQIAQQIGMNASVLQQRIERGIYRNTVMRQREIAGEVGLTGVPAILINGRFIDGRSRNVACITQLIEEEASRS